MQIGFNHFSFRLEYIPSDTAGYVKGEDGRPSGLIEDPLIARVLARIQPADETELVTTVDAAVGHALRTGIATLHMKEPYGTLKTIVRHEERFPIRIKPICAIASGDCGELTEILSSEAFGRRTVAAFFADGAPDSRTAAFFEPYAGGSTNYGMLYYSDETLGALLEKVHCAGFQVSVHTCGTRATEQVLDTSE